MQIDHQTGSYLQVRNTPGDVVFTRTYDQEIWPAKIIRINKSHTYRVAFFARKELATVTEDQIWPFNSLTIQRFVSYQSPAELVEAIEAAHHSLEKKGNNLEEERHQLRIIRSLDESMDDLSDNALMLIHHPLPLNSKGLFVIHEVNQTLQESKACLSFQNCQTQEGNDEQDELVPQKRKRKKTSDLLLCQEQEDIFVATKTRMITKHCFDLEPKRKKRRYRRKHKKNLQKKEETVQNLNLKLTGGSKNQEKTQNEDKETQKTVEMVEELRINNSPDQGQPLFEPVEEPALEIPYGPLNLSQVSTEATMHPDTISSHSVPVNSTAATINDFSSRTFEFSEKNPQNFSVDSNQTTSVPKDHSFIEEQKHNFEEPIYQMAQTMMQFIKSLKKVLMGKRKKLTVKEQLKFCHLMDTWNYSEVSKVLLEETVQFLIMFQANKGSFREKCYVQYLLLKQKMTNLALTSTIEGCHDPELNQIYQNITGSLLHYRL